MTTRDWIVGALERARQRNGENAPWTLQLKRQLQEIDTSLPSSVQRLSVQLSGEKPKRQRKQKPVL